MKTVKKHKTQLLAMFLSTIIITSSFTGSVFGSQTDDETRESVFIKSEELSDDSDESMSEEDVADESNDTVEEENSSESENVNESAQTNDISKSSSPTDYEQISEDASAEVEKEGTDSSSADAAAEVPAGVEIDHSDLAEDDIEIPDNDAGTENAPDAADQENNDFFENAPAEEVVVTDAQNEDSSDFLIEDGVLVEYYGDGGDVVVPDGVTSMTFFN